VNAPSSPSRRWTARIDRDPGARGNGRWGRRAAWGLILLAAGVLLGCGEREKPPPAQTLPVQSVQVRVELMSPVPPLAEALRSWESRQGVQVVVTAREGASAVPTPGTEEAPGPGMDRDEGTQVSPALREIALSELGARVDAGDVRPLPAAVAARARALLGGEGCVRADTVYAVPFRLDLTALAIRSGESAAEPTPLVPTWESLATLTRTVGPFGVDASVGPRLLGCYLPLLWSAAGAVIDTATGNPRLRTDAGVEALSFLAQLVRDGARLPSADLERAFGERRVGVLPLDLARLRALRTVVTDVDLQLVPFPRAGEARGEPAVLLAPRVLILPRGGPYADLAAELALVLATLPSQDPASPVLGGGRFLAVGPDAAPPTDPWLAQAHALRRWGKTMPLEPRATAMEAAIEEAVDATLDRRRHPDLALSEADRILQESAQRP
jgi:hypothetical protein